MSASDPRMTLKWTRTPPTEAGWYWMRYEYLGGAKSVNIAYIKHGERPRLSTYIEWSGPIPLPEEAS